ncbi:MAG: hypothetical protein P8182_15145, partial [Deltaproteobacteria bacterium]
MKRTLNAGQVVTDIRAGMSDAEIMKKYHLSARGLASLFTKLLEAGFIEQSSLSARVDLGARTVSLRIYRCPKCDMPQAF